MLYSTCTLISVLNKNVKNDEKLQKRQLILNLGE